MLVCVHQVPIDGAIFLIKTGLCLRKTIVANQVWLSDMGFSSNSHYYRVNEVRIIRVLTGMIRKTSVLLCVWRCDVADFKLMQASCAQKSSSVFASSISQESRCSQYRWLVNDCH